jgi:DNA-binding LacI/PurR family transcriptional regulator
MDWDPIAHAVLPALPGYLPVVSTKAPAPGAAPLRPYVTLDERVGAQIGVDHQIAVGAMRAIWEHGLMVPGDISVIGFDNDPLAGVETPTLIIRESTAPPAARCR